MSAATELASGTSQRSRMGRPSHRVRLAALAIALLATACSKSSDDHGASATPSALASPTAAATVAPAPAAPSHDPTTVSDTRTTYLKNGVEASMGQGTEADFSAIGLPVYPTLQTQNTYVVKHVDKRSSAFTLQGSVKDGIAVVGDWYAKRLGPSFKASRMNVLGGIVSFGRKLPGSSESVFLQAQKDENLGIPLTTITLTVTKRR